ncbi:Vam7p [Saccharomyces cerevisiae x Saccharomyces kudriavzevii VIN7]|uniref:Vam7p n=1 Tax=Saccharomyces cerevisiae x Saccharomyces kudriavzevii (strain VIN7) TaxID=1095631 RepID=H0GUI9_SACCK|nr:Vam7p [Saccharomyces cerevisiae x Saccharomyces kudriavzevii VIN7]CAI5268010.1 AIS_HP2_G0017260.mRNA.1.CDS.1 [Saccharomyces cerevisiae]CAI6497807.1 AIS_HP2_G0017260.mRNA.1.CDS.1 [Saccharomyces cerevisiae]
MSDKLRIHVDGIDIKPKYVLYRISTPTKLFYKRYSEFWRLKTQLEKQIGSPIPYDFPEKPSVLDKMWQRRYDDPEMIDERRVGLERFLNELYNDRFDSRWRDTKIAQNFLQLSKAKASQEEPKQRQDAADEIRWDELIRDVKLDLDEESDDTPSVRRVLRARTKLHKLRERLERDVQKKSLPGTEVTRRAALLRSLLKECDNIGVANTTQDRGRLLGVAAAETSSNTDSQGRTNNDLQQGQVQMVRDQEQELVALHRIIQAQRGLALDMNEELQTQNELLTALEDDVDNTGRRLQMANRKARQFNNSA